MIDEADRDGDGEVNLEEFERIMRVSLPNTYTFIAGHASLPDFVSTHPLSLLEPETRLASS